MSPWCLFLGNSQGLPRHRLHLHVGSDQYCVDLGVWVWCKEHAVKCNVAVYTAGGGKRPRSKKIEGKDKMRKKPRSEQADKGKEIDPRE